MRDSVTESNAYYSRIGVRGMARWQKHQFTRDHLALVKRVIGDRKLILDAGCGYGRITIPLAKDGRAVVGVDILPAYLEEARRRASKRGANAAFVHGSFTDLSLPDASFDAVICMWTTLNHLLTLGEQRRALREMYRLLKPEGVALIETRNGSLADMQRLVSEQGFGPDGRLIRYKAAGHETTVYLHDEESLHQLTEESPFGGSRIFRPRVAGGRRIAAVLTKPSSGRWFN